MVRRARHHEPERADRPEAPGVPPLAIQPLEFPPLHKY
jgi:hypothetical protein